MGIINTILGVPLGFAIYLFYGITGSYGLAVVIFAVFVKIVIIPVNRMAHRNSIKLLRLQPALGTIRHRYAGDKERLNEEQYELFTKEKYSPLLGLLPLFIQLFLVIGMLQVMYHPLQHILRLDSEVIGALTAAIAPLHEGNVIEQLAVLAAAGQSENLLLFQEALAPFYNGGAILTQLINIDLNFLGINLGIVPSLTNPSIELVVPVFALAAALAFCLVQNRLSPGALSQSKRTGLLFTIFTMGLSLYFSLVTPAGVGLYWSLGNLAAIGVVLILNSLYNPKKLAAEALVYINANRKTPQQQKEEKHVKKTLAARERQDAAGFAAAKKQVVFYAISGGQYKYYAEVIDYIINHSDIQIHYLTNDPNDAVFNNENPRLIAYYAGHSKTIGLMMRLETEMLVTTVPGLHNYHIKRSVVCKDIEYIYIHHGFTSMHMVMRPGALDYFDTVFCVGEHHVNEIRRMEELRGTGKKRLVKAGYSMFDRLTTRYKNTVFKPGEKTQILIAPSWQAENIMESCIDRILEQLLSSGHRVIVRPHPEYIKAHNNELKDLQKRNEDSVLKGNLVFEVDFGESSSMYISDLVITDWSNTAYEFSFCTKKPSLFINTPMKVLNPDYKDVGIEPQDIILRDKMGVSIDVENLNKLTDTIRDILANQEAYSESISQTISELIYYPMRSGEAGGTYIASRLNSIS